MRVDPSVDGTDIWAHSSGKASKELSWLDQFGKRIVVWMDLAKVTLLLLLKWDINQKLKYNDNN